MSNRYSSSHAATLVAALFASLAIGLSAGTVSSVTPLGASSTVTISITGTGFNVVAASNTVTFRHVVSGVATTASGTAIQTVDATRGIRRLSVKVPTGAPVGTTAVRVRDTATGEESDAGNVEVLRLTFSGITSGAVGTSQQVRIVGSPNVIFAITNTRAGFGAGITIQSTVVESPTSLVANIVIAANAAIGARVVTVQTTNQTATTETAFMVTAAGTPANRIPTANAGGPYSGRVNVPIALSGSGSDPDGDPVTLTWDFGDSAVATGATPTHTYATAGTYAVVLTVSDGRGGSATSQVSVLVEPPLNHAPLITSTPVTTATQDQAYGYQLVANDSDGDAVTYGLRQAPTGMSVGPSGFIQWTPLAPDVGATSVIVEALDGRGGSALQTFTINVAAANRMPLISSTPVTTARAQQPYSYQLQTSDPDGDSLSYLFQQAPSGMSVSATGAIQWTPASTHVGSNDVIIEVRDGRGGSAVQAFAVIVAAANRPPVANAGGPYQGSVNAAINFDGAASADPDQGQLLTFVWDFGDGSTGTGASPVHGYSAEGNFVVTLTVDDGDGGTSQATATVAVVTPALGIGVIAGRVFDDASGLPLAGASAKLLNADGTDAARPPTITDVAGRFRLSTTPGLSRVRVTRAGYTRAERAVVVIDGKRVDPLDIRLAPIDSLQTRVSSVVGGVVTNTSGTLTLQLPPGALNADETVTLTPAGVQSAGATVPLGWSAIGIAVIQAGTAAFNRPATLSLRAPPDLPRNAAIVVARWNEQSGVWIAEGDATRGTDEDQLLATVASSGEHALLVADQAPEGPGAPVTGAPIEGVASRGPPSSVTATITPSPRILFARPDARSLVGVSVTPSSPIPSGTPLAVEVTESFDLTGGRHLDVAPSGRTVRLQHVNAGELALRSGFQVAPSRRILPFALRRGVIDLAARLLANPFEGRGTVIGPAGGSAAAETGERLTVPGSATVDYLPAIIAPLNTTGITLPVPNGFSLLGGAYVDLHGGTLTQPATIAIAAPTGLPADAFILVVALAEVDNATRPVLIAAAQRQGAALVSVTEPLSGVSLGLPGIRGDGRYLFLRSDAPLGFLTGTINGSDGSPVRDAIVDGGSGILAMTDAAGHYVLAGAPGDVLVRVTNPGTGDTTTLSGRIESPQTTSTASTSLGPTPPFVIAVTPADGLTNVSRAAVVSVAFSEPIDPASFAGGTIAIFSGGTTVGGAVSLAPGNATVVFQPGVLLSSGADYELRITAAVRDVAGNAMTAPFVSRFTTLDDTPPPRPPSGAISATIPNASGASTVSGTQGTAVPGGVVRIRNLRTGSLTTMTPNADGSFAGVVSALRTDHLELIIVDAANNSTTVAVPPFRNADGSVVMGATGGHLEAAGGLVLDVPAGALPDGTVVKLDPLTEAQLPVPVPTELGLVGGFRLDLGGVIAARELEISVPAPNGAAARQVVVAQAIPFRSSSAWTVVERAHFNESKYETASPPFVGVLAGGSYAFLQWDDANVCVSYVSIQYSFQENVFLLPNLMPFIFFTTDVNRTTMPAYCGAQLNVQVLEPNTNEVIQTISYFAPAAADDIAYPPDLLTDDHTPPDVLSLNNPTGQEVAMLEVRFTKSLNPASVNDHFLVNDSEGNAVPGTIEMSERNSHLVFRPDHAFQLGEQYTVVMAGITDTAGNPIGAQPLTFTPYGPRSISELRTSRPLADALEKCGLNGCSTSALDVAFIGKTLFIANGVRQIGDEYHDPANPDRLIAVDVTDPFHPVLIGRHATTTNPRALAAVTNATLNTSAGTFTGDLLLVAGGGRVTGGELSGKLEVWDVSACTRRPAVGNCLSDGLKGYKLLSTATGVPPRSGVPPDNGIPLQVTTIHQRAPLPVGDTLLAYVLTIPIGIEAINVSDAFNIANTATGNFGPDGLLRGDFVDLTAIKHRLLAVGRDLTNNLTMSVLTAQLGKVDDLPSPPSPLLPPQGAARIAAGENLVYDLDQDGRVGTAEDQDEDAGTARGEIFDLALVSSGILETGCVGQPPCGELYVYDVSTHTDLAHAPPGRFLDVIPLPAPAFSAYIDSAERLAYVELRGKGVAVVDLSFLLDNLRGEAAATGFIDSNEDAVDDRVLAVVPTGSGQDLALARIKVDVSRGVAYVSGITTGVEVVQVANKATELALDFGVDASVNDQSLAEERDALLGLINGAVAALRTEFGPSELVSALEQGSGSCFWRETFPVDPSSTCPAFQPGTSDHDIEIFVPQPLVRRAQQILNAFIKSKPAGLNKLGDLSLFAMPRDAFAAAELLNGTPLYGEGVGDATGDLGMGRQILLLLWLLEGAYVPGHQGDLPNLNVILETLRAKQRATAVVPDAHEPSGIPRLEGYEWSLLQEFNFFKTGAMLRVKGGCDAANPRTVEARHQSSTEGENEPSGNFNDEGFLGETCEDEIHGVAKAAIRTVLARVVADEAGNALVLNIDPDDPNAPGDEQLRAYKSDACFKGPFTAPYNHSEATGPQTDGPYSRVSCTGFEHYILSVAVKTFMRELGIFQVDQLPLLYRFYCLKIGHDNCNVPSLSIQSDEDADNFLREALTFIRVVQGETRPRYVETVMLDNKQIGPIPLLDLGPAEQNAGPGIGAICGGLFGQHGSKLADFLFGSPLPSVIAPQIPNPPDGPQGMRKLLRLCNYLIVYLKTHGDETVVLSGGVENKHAQINSSTLSKLKQRLGAEHYVDWNLQTRAINFGVRHVDVNLAIYEGNGTDTLNYTTLKTQRVGLLGAERRVIDVEPVPGSDDPDKRRPIFPLLFNLTRTELASGQARALTFFIDPDGTIPEANRRDNQAGFFYYLLQASATSPPSTDDDPALPLEDEDLEPDPLAVERPRVSFDFTVRPRSSSTPFGAKQISVGVYEPVELKYDIRNVSSLPLENVRIFRDGVLVAQVPRLEPAGAPGGHDHAQLTDPTPFVPTDTGQYRLSAYLLAKDEDGNTVGPAYDLTSVKATEDLAAFKVRLFDASPLAEQNHPFSRFLANRDDAGHEVPLLGAVTDGAGRVRVEIERLTPGQVVSFSLVDGELPAATDGLGTLAATDIVGPQLPTVADISGRAVLYYWPPSVFVRDAHRAEDVQKQERAVRIRVVQAGVGSGFRTIKLRRPPVFLVHGLFSTRKTWNEMQPLVPASGVGAAYKPVKGFDGRFDVFAVGTPFSSGTFEQESAALKEQIRGSLALSLPGYAIGKIDVIGHSMGGLLTRRLANEFAAAGLASPFRKLIAVDTPFGGSALASKIREIRGEAAVTLEDQGHKDLLGIITNVKELNLGEELPQSGVEPEIKVAAKIHSCPLIIQTIGLTPRFFTHGAMQDLEIGSPELMALQNAGISIPSHHIVGETATPGLGIGWEVYLLWGALGQYCSLTPDSSTVDATVLFQTGVKIVQTAASLSQTVRGIKSVTPKLEVSVKKFPASSVSASTEAFLKRAGPIAQVLQDEATADEIKPVFASTENDRIVESASQAGGLNPGDQTVSSVVGVTDHTEIIESPGVPASACNLAPNSLPNPTDLNGDGAIDVGCRLIHLLEAAPSSPFFTGAP